MRSAAEVLRFMEELRSGKRGSSAGPRSRSGA